MKPTKDARVSARVRVTLAIAFASILGAIAFVVLIQPSGSKVASASRPGTVQKAALHGPQPHTTLGVPPRTANPADSDFVETHGGWLVKQHRWEDVQGVLASAIDTDELFEIDFEKWWRVISWLGREPIDDDHGNSLRRCVTKHLPEPSEMCSGDMAVVVKRTGPEAGKIVFARGIVDEDMPEYCASALSCLAREAWVGDKSPLPDSEQDMFAFTFAQRFNRPILSQEEYDFMREEMHRMRAEVHDLRRTASAFDYKLQYKIEMRQRHVESLESFLRGRGQL